MTPDDPDASLAPAEFRIGSTDFIVHFGGFARLDVIYDINGMGSVDQFVPWTIPLDGSGEPNLYFDPRKSRMFLEARYPNSFADLGARIEVDFYTATNSPRIRRAFGTFGRFLFGQEWTVFSDSEWIPPTLDFENPIAYVVQRNPQLRYTHPLGVEGLDATVSAEYLPLALSNDLTAAIPGEVRTLVPDIVLRVRYARAGVHASLHGLMRNFFYDIEGGDRTHFVGWGVNAILGYAMDAGHRLYLQGVAGSALGSYRGGRDVNLDRNGEGLPLNVGGATAGAQVQWRTDQALSSNFVGSLTTSLGDTLEGTDNSKLAVYTAANLVWSPYQYFRVGLEYLFGYHLDYMDRDGYDNRLQLTAQATLP